MSSSEKMENIFTSARPFLILMKYLGLFPVTFDGSHLRITWSNHLISCCKLMLWITVVVVNVLNFELIPVTSIIIKNVFNVSLAFGLCSVLVMSCFQWFQCKHILRLLESIKVFDTNVCIIKGLGDQSIVDIHTHIFQLKSLSVNVDFKIHKRFSVSFTVFTIALVVVVMFAGNVSYLGSEIVFIDVMISSFAYVLLYSCMFILQFIFASLAIRERFKLLNDYLR